MKPSFHRNGHFYSRVRFLTRENCSGKKDVCGLRVVVNERAFQRFTQGQKENKDVRLYIPFGLSRLGHVSCGVSFFCFFCLAGVNEYTAPKEKRAAPSFSVNARGARKLRGTSDSSVRGETTLLSPSVFPPFRLCFRASRAFCSPASNFEKTRASPDAFPSAKTLYICTRSAV